MNSQTGDGKRTAIGIALAGLAIEVTTLLLLRGGRVSASIATPLMITGMLMAFVPLFVLARRARR